VDRLVGSVDIAVFVFCNQLTNDAVVQSRDVLGLIGDFELLLIATLGGCSDFDAAQLSLCPIHECFLRYLTSDI